MGGVKVLNSSAVESGFLEQEGGGEAAFSAFADGYIAVVYLSTGGALVLEPDATPGSNDAAWVPPTAALARREIAVEAGRLVAWPNYAYKHGAGLMAAEGGAEDGAAPRKKTPSFFSTTHPHRDGQPALRGRRGRRRRRRRRG